MKTTAILMACSCILLPALVATAADEASPQLAEQLRAVMATNMKCLTEKNLDLAMSAFHSKSPGYLPTRDVTKKLFEDYNIKIRVLSLQVIGSDQDYAVARVKYEATQDKGPAYRNSASDTMQIFRKEGKQWKLWASASLDIKYLQ